MTTRREFLGDAAHTALGATLPLTAMPVVHTADSAAASAPRTFADIGREPDAITVQTPSGFVQLVMGSTGEWSNERTLITILKRPDALNVALASPAVAVLRVHLRWHARLDGVHQILGDAWERGYGDLEWRGWVPDRVMPWYMATFDGALTHAYGVRTGARAFCFWQVDPQGISLWADVRSGGVGVQLSERTLDVCDVISRAGREGESSFAALHAFCRQMCPNPRLPRAPLYGSNDWYWAYGKNSAESVLADANHIVELSPSDANRPFAVIDDGWQPGRGASKTGVGTWDRGNEKFPDMPGVAASVKRAGARPGIWIRPLQAPAEAPDGWRLPRDHAYLDPTIPEARQKIVADIARLREWGFELIKHDYTTFDIFGRWGFQMGVAMTRDGWTFGSGASHTTAEVIDDLYGAIRGAADTSLVIGCNTVSHLSAGHFEICRVGDDTSGTEWSRTRKMGVNTLAFRGVQHGAFYVADADCVGVTTALPWSLNKQWLDILSRSGTMVFVSLASDALGVEQRRDLKTALAMAATAQPLGEPLDWRQTVYPARWRLQGRERVYDWIGADGAGLP